VIESKTKVIRMDESDLTKTIIFLKCLNIGYKIKQNEQQDGCTLKIKEGYENVAGYSRFYCMYEFDGDEKLTRFGVWE